MKRNLETNNVGRGYRVAVRRTRSVGVRPSGVCAPTRFPLAAPFPGGRTCRGNRSSVFSGGPLSCPLPRGPSGTSRGWVGRRRGPGGHRSGKRPCESAARAPAPRGRPRRGPSVMRLRPGCAASSEGADRMAVTHRASLGRVCQERPVIAVGWSAIRLLKGDTK